MDYFQTLAIITEAYKAGLKNAPTVETIGLENTIELPRRCIFCNGSTFVEQVITDYDDNYTVVEVVCEDCGMPVDVE